MPKRKESSFFISRKYLHNDGEITVDRPNGDVHSRVLEFWPDKETRDAAAEDDSLEPLASVEISLPELAEKGGEAILVQLAAIGLNYKLNSVVDASATVEENVKALEEYCDLLRSGTLREAGAGPGTRIPVFVRDFHRAVQLARPDIADNPEWTLEKAAQQIEAMESSVSEEDFKAWRTKFRASAEFQTALAERRMKEAKTKQTSAADLLEGVAA